MKEETFDQKLEKVTKQMDEIIKEYGQFANIPRNSPYWGLRNERDRLMNLKDGK